MVNRQRMDLSKNNVLILDISDLHALLQFLEETCLYVTKHVQWKLFILKIAEHVSVKRFMVTQQVKPDNFLQKRRFPVSHIISRITPFRLYVYILGMNKGKHRLSNLLILLEKHDTTSKLDFFAFDYCNSKLCRMNMKKLSKL